MQVGDKIIITDCMFSDKYVGKIAIVYEIDKTIRDKYIYLVKFDVKDAIYYWVNGIPYSPLMLELM